MTTIQIPAVIRPALKAELFGAKDTPRMNSIYFIKKHMTNEYQGVFTVSESTETPEFIYQYIFNELHVIVTEGTGFCFLMNLRLGNQYDVVQGEYLRLNYSYYVMGSDNFLEGPYQIHYETDPYEIAAFINNKQLYVVAEKQSFIPYQMKNTA